MPPPPPTASLPGYANTEGQQQPHSKHTRIISTTNAYTAYKKLPHIRHAYKRLSTILNNGCTNKFLAKTKGKKNCESLFSFQLSSADLPSI